MQIKIRDIGNSKGIIIPKNYYETLGKPSAVNLTSEDGIIKIEPIKEKEDWSDFENLSSDGLEETIVISNKREEEAFLNSIKSALKDN
jgi:antitoxin component of MazEF toxin-antitoxin module